jgi:hypothetical protein
MADVRPHVHPDAASSARHPVRSPQGRIVPARPGHDGQPLPTQVARPIAASLDVDITPVRVHSGSSAAVKAEALGARAFAFGADIVLGRSARVDDVALMAHEVAHVIQQQGVRRLQLWSPDSADRYESEARRASTAVVHERPFSVSERTSPQPQRLAGALAATQPAVGNQKVTDFQIVRMVQIVQARVWELCKRWGIPQPLPLSPGWVKAMIQVEAPPGSVAHDFDPMQVANAGDSLTAMMSDNTFAVFATPALIAKINAVDPTPFNNGHWDHAAPPKKGKVRIDADTSLECGITLLFYKAARWPASSTAVEIDGVDRTTVARKGETSMWAMWKRLAKEGEPTDMATLAASNPKAVSALKEGMTIIYRRTRMERRAETGWHSWAEATTLYNTNKKVPYLKNVQSAYDKLTK